MVDIILDLPNEILAHIFQNLNRKDFKAVACTCKCFYSFAEYKCLRNKIMRQTIRDYSAGDYFGLYKYRDRLAQEESFPLAQFLSFRYRGKVVVSNFESVYQELADGADYVEVIESFSNLVDGVMPSTQIYNVLNYIQAEQDTDVAIRLVNDGTVIHLGSARKGEPFHLGSRFIPQFPLLLCVYSRIELLFSSCDTVRVSYILWGNSVYHSFNHLRTLQGTYELCNGMKLQLSGSVAKLL